VPSILIVDDERNFCDILKTFLGGKGHEVEAAMTASEVNAYLKNTHPDLVLLDVRMPDTSGLELLPRIKATSPDSFVIVVTALNDYRIADLLYEAGADGYLTKPVRLEALDRTINHFLNQRPAPSV
jgi:DNA-binding response OmpR family regulator